MRLLKYKWDAHRFISFFIEILSCDWSHNFVYVRPYQAWIGPIRPLTHTNTPRVTDTCCDHFYEMELNRPKQVGSLQAKTMKFRVIWISFVSLNWYVNVAEIFSQVKPLSTSMKTWAGQLQFFDEISRHNSLCTILCNNCWSVFCIYSDLPSMLFWSRGKLRSKLTLKLSVDFYSWEI